MKLIGIGVCIAAGLALAWLLAPAEPKPKAPVETVAPTKPPQSMSIETEVEMPAHTATRQAPDAPPEATDESIAAAPQADTINRKSLLRTLSQLDQAEALSDEDIEATLELLDQLNPEDQERLLQELVEGDFPEE